MPPGEGKGEGEGEVEGEGEIPAEEAIDLLHLELADPTCGVNCYGVANGLADAGELLLVTPVVQVNPDLDLRRWTGVLDSNDRSVAQSVGVRVLRLERSHGLGAWRPYRPFEVQVDRRLPGRSVASFRLKLFGPDGELMGPLAVEFDAWGVLQIEISSVIAHDDNVGPSLGDGDGLIEPGETIGLQVTLRNTSEFQAPRDEGRTLALIVGSFGAAIVGQSGGGQHVDVGDVAPGEQISVEVQTGMTIGPFGGGCFVLTWAVHGARPRPLYRHEARYCFNVGEALGDRPCQAAEEVCNHVDDDCDSEVDEFVLCVRGDDCENAWDVELTPSDQRYFYFFEDDASNDFTPSCGNGGPGRDRVFALHVPKLLGPTRFTLHGSENAILELRRGPSCEEPVVVACHQAAPGAALAIIEVDRLEAGDYWLIADSSAEGGEEFASVSWTSGPRLGVSDERRRQTRVGWERREQLVRIESGRRPSGISRLHDDRLGRAGWACVPGERRLDPRLWHLRRPDLLLLLQRSGRGWRPHVRTRTRRGAQAARRCAHRAGRRGARAVQRQHRRGGHSQPGPHPSTGPRVVPVREALR